MAKYSDIKGFTVQTVSSDPAASVAATGSWATGGSLNTGRESAGTSGTLTAGLYAGGYNITAAVEKYDGTSWTEVSDLNTARRQLKAAGTANTANIVFGGDTTGNATGLQAITETWDGSSWTEVADLATARGGGGGAQNISSSTSALYFGGNTGNTNTEEWTAADFLIKSVTTS